MGDRRNLISPPENDNKVNIQDTHIPHHEILTRLAATLTEKIANQIPNVELSDIKNTLEHAVGVLGKQNNQVKREDGTLDLNKVLIADDVEENRFLMKHIFLSADSEITVSEASNGEEALAKAQTELPVLIVSDIQMPKINGLELLKKLKANKRTKDIAVILATAYYRDSKQVSQGLDLGADDYIQRPFVLNEFMSRVKAVIRVKRVEAEVRRQAHIVNRRNRGLKLVNDLALAVNSSLDLQKIFSHSIQKLSSLLNAKAVSLLLLDEEKKQLVISSSSHLEKYITDIVDFDQKENLSIHLTQEQIPELVLNSINKHGHDLGIDFPVTVDTIQYVPMVARDKLHGAIALVSNSKKLLDEADKDLLYSAAGIIAVAIENTRLLNNTRRQVDDLIALNEIGHALSSTLDLDQILKQTTLLVQKSLQAEQALLWLLDETDQQLSLIASSGSQEEIDLNAKSIYRNIAKHVAQTDKVYISANVHIDETYSKYITTSNKQQPCSFLCIPVKIKDRIIGIMQAAHKNKNWFNQNHLRLSYFVANSVGIAVENARLFNKVQNFNQYLEKMVSTRTTQLANEKEKTEAILASMADGLLVLDAKGCILTANTVAENMLNFRLSQQLGQPINEKQLKKPLWRCIYNITTNNTESTISALVDVPAKQTGKTLSIQAHSAEVRNDKGQVIGTVIVLRDITALKEIEKMQARFMAGVTHELKTPLAIIHLHSGNLLAYHHRLSEQKRYDILTAIQNQVKLLKQLIENILHLSRLDGGIVETNLITLNLVKLIDKIVTDLHPLAQARQITLYWQNPATDVKTIASANQIERVIRNLIDNAIKYTPDGGSVKVQTFTELTEGQLFAKVQVIDTGVGIPLQHQSQIFERFYRVDPSHTIPGTGLGLSIVKEIVNAHGGTIQLNSVPKAGSTFIVTLPGQE